LCEMELKFCYWSQGWAHVVLELCLLPLISFLISPYCFVLYIFFQSK
jgi:hypothetical protein